MRTDRINFLDLHFDQLSLKDLKDRLLAVGAGTPYAYLVTPNVDHVVRVHREPRLRALYDAADICVCDSRVLRLLARLRGIKLPLVPGSDLSAALFSGIIKPGDRIAIVGSDEACVEQLSAKFPEVDIRHFQPPMGLATNPDARRSAAAFVAGSQPRFAFIAVGSPQQEMIAREIRDYFPAATGVGLCIGAGLDFIVGKQKRAPRALQRLGLEWAHRLASNPRRLWRRYLVEGARILPIYLGWRGGRRLWPFGLAVLAAGTAGLVYLAPWSAGKGQASDSQRLPPSEPAEVAAIKALPPPNLLKPLTPEEASKENAERPFSGRADTPARRFVLKTDGDDRARALTCLAQAIYYEAAGEGTDGGRAVAQVVLNRLRHPGYPTTICGVVYQGADRPSGCQFSFTCDGSMRRIPVPALWTRSREIAEQALDGQVFAPVGHATHYHADYVLPYWADSLDKSVQIGRHIFYRLRNSLGDARAFSQRYGGTEPPVREPGATIVMPTTAETQQLASTLMSDGLQNGAKDAEKAAPPPSPPLLADSSAGTLLIDGQGAQAQAPRTKSPTECAASASNKQLKPLAAEDMHASPDAPGC